MSIFGTSYPVISGSLGNVSLEQSKVDYNFFGSDVIEQKSVLTGHKSYPYSRNRSTFTVDVLLCNYSGASSSLSKFNDIYKYRDSYFYFQPHSDFTESVDGVGGGIEYYMTEIIPYYLNNDITYDGVIIKMMPRKNSILKAYVPAGYGTAFGLDYGGTGW